MNAITVGFAMGQNPIGWVEQLPFVLIEFSAGPSLVALPLKAANRVRVAFGAVRKVTNARLGAGSRGKAFGRSWDPLVSGVEQWAWLGQAPKSRCQHHIVIPVHRNETGVGKCPF